MSRLKFSGGMNSRNDCPASFDPRDGFFLQGVDGAGHSGCGGVWGAGAVSKDMVSGLGLVPL